MHGKRGRAVDYGADESRSSSSAALSYAELNDGKFAPIT